MVRYLVDTVVQTNDDLAFSFSKVGAYHRLWKTCNWLVHIVKAEHLSNVKVIYLFSNFVNKENFLDAVVLVCQGKVLSLEVLFN